MCFALKESGRQCNTEGVWQAERMLKRSDRMCKGRILSLLKGWLRNLKRKSKKNVEGKTEVRFLEMEKDLSKLKENQLLKSVMVWGRSEERKYL